MISLISELLTLKSKLFLRIQYPDLLEVDRFDISAEFKWRDI